MPESSVYKRAPPTISELEWRMGVCLKNFHAETQRQKESVRDTEASQATRETRETTEDGSLRPWREGLKRHLNQYTAAATEEYTKGGLLADFTAFGKELEVPYSKLDGWGTAFLLAKSRKQTEIGRELLSGIQNTRMAASTRAESSISTIPPSCASQMSAVQPSSISTTQSPQRPLTRRTPGETR